MGHSIFALVEVYDEKRGKRTPSFLHKLRELTKNQVR